MSRFSERMGYSAARSLVQRDDLDGVSRVAAWNAVHVTMTLLEDGYRTTELSRLKLRLWLHHFNGAQDEEPDHNKFWSAVKAKILSAPFPEAMDMIEDFLVYLEPDDPYDSEIFDLAVEQLNQSFEKHLVGYRIVGARLTPFDSEAEIGAVREAISDAPNEAREHLERALSHLADRANPDYRNSVKESVTAVESLARQITGAQNLGAALPRLADLGIETHPALVSAWKGFYGYTSDAGGIRHGGHRIAKVNQAFAKYVLVTCSAFVTWLSEEARVEGKL